MAGGKAAASILSSTEFPLSCSVWLRQPTGSWIPAFFTVSAEVRLGMEAGFVRGYNVYHTGHPLMPSGTDALPLLQNPDLQGFPKTAPSLDHLDLSRLVMNSRGQPFHFPFVGGGAKQCDVGHRSQLQASAVPAFIQQGRVTLNMSPW